LRCRSRSPAETRAAARALGEAIEATPEARGIALVVGLSGPLGAGKTEWVRGLAEGLGADPRTVASPTFVIASEYPARRPLAHVDLYRLEGEGELLAAGFLDLLAPGAVVAVEWADRLPAALPADRLDVSIERDPAEPGGGRRLAVAARGPISERVLAHLARDRREGDPAWR
jgi:tRNA threonylcarbamoyladenosine biosynthesis protein TsaE